MVVVVGGVEVVVGGGDVVGGAEVVVVRGGTVIVVVVVVLEGGGDVVVVGGVEVVVDGSTADVEVVETAKVAVVLAAAVLDGDTTEEAVEEVAVGTVVLAVTATVLRVSVLPSLSPPAEHAVAANITMACIAIEFLMFCLFASFIYVASKINKIFLIKTAKPKCAMVFFSLFFSNIRSTIFWQNQKIP